MHGSAASPASTASPPSTAIVRVGLENVPVTGGRLETSRRGRIPRDVSVGAVYPGNAHRATLTISITAASLHRGAFRTDHVSTHAGG